MLHPAPAAPGSSNNSPLDTLGKTLPDPVRRLGEVMARKRDVHLVRRSDRVLEARVGSGAEAQAVAIHWNGEALAGTCSCPYHLSRRQTCPHVWATAVVAGEIGWSPWSAKATTAPRATLESRTAERPRGRQGWRRTLDAIHAAPPEEPSPLHDWRPGRTLLYVIDVPMTMESQQLTIEVLRRDLRRDGYPGRARRARIPYAALDRLPDPADRTALAMLFGAAPAGLPSWADDAYRGNAIAATFRVPGPLHRPLVSQLCNTGRAFLRLKPGSVEDRPLTWEENPWRLHLELRRKDGALELGGVLRRAGESARLSTPKLLLASGLAFFVDSVAPLAHHEAFGWISHLRRDEKIEVPENELEPLFDALDQQPRLPPLDLPSDLALEEEDAEPVGHLRLALPSGGDPSTLEAELGFLYAGRPVEPADPRTLVPDLRRRRLIRRQPEGEARALRRLEELELVSSDNKGWRIPASSMPMIARTLLQEGWVVEAEGRRMRSSAPPRLSVKAGVDWFELGGEIDFDGEKVPLPELLAALAAKRPTVRLGDGTEGLLPEEWLERYAYLAGLADVNGDVLRFGRSQLPLLDALLGERQEVSFDQHSQAALAALASGREPKPRDTPKELRGVLRDYQRVGLGWLIWLTEIGLGGCLADDMGLGKTVQVLALLVTRQSIPERRARSLVVVPRSVVFNWQGEAARFAPGLTVATHLGAERASRATDLPDAELLLTTYGTLRRDISWMREVPFDVCVLDEAQAIKNPMTATAKAVRLIDAHHRIALSGTPIENHLGELWSLFEFLNPGLLGSSRTLRRAVELEREGDGRRLLSRTVRPLLLRRTKAEVAPELPERTELVLCCPLDGDQRRLYDELRQHYRAQLLSRPAEGGGEPVQMEVLEALLRLRQAACHPALLDPTRRHAGSAKLETLLPHLEEIVDEGHKALVYSQFTRFLALVREELDERGIPYSYLDGQTRDRGAAVERFQNDPDCKIFLISLKAGGLGLNLTAADYVFLLDPWWNPAAEAQAIDRAHRIGQERHVFAYRLIAEDTVEEKVLELQEEKRELAASVLGGNTEAGPLDLAALRQLLG